MTGSPAQVVAARTAIDDAVAAQAFPAAVADVGGSAGSIWAEAFGRLSFDADAPPVTPGTVFDLASLTKPLATTTIAMDLVGRGVLALEARIADLAPEWRGADRQSATVRDLLEHASGLPARLLDAPPTSRREFVHEVCTIPLEYAPRTRSVYSDVGFILLGFILEDAGGAPFDVQFDDVCRRLGIDGLFFAGVGGPTRRSAFPPPAVGRRAGANGFAPTDPLPEDRRKRRLIGEVQDNYAYALGGVAGHAGVFGTAPAVAAFARLVLRAARGDAGVPPPLAPPLVQQFTARTIVPGSSRALGWDTMLPTSSCGTRMSPSAFGHVGYTGTSLWIDPARDRYFVLLTNRAAGGRMVDRMREVRAFHDALAGL